MMHQLLIPRVHVSVTAVAGIVDVSGATATPNPQPLRPRSPVLA